MMRKLLATGIGLIMLVGSAQTALADQEKNGSKVTMDEVVVTATKTKEKREDIANAVIVVDDMDIEASPATSVGALLGNELGVDWRTRGNYGGAAQEIHMRGMGGDGTQVLINGVTTNSPSLGTADVGRIPLNAIDRIEVVKGSGSVLYGSGAMGGLVNIITKDPERDRMDLKASAGYGSENTYQISAEQGMYVFGDLGYYLTANRTETDGFRDNSDLTHNDASIKLVWDKGDKLHLSLYGDYIDREYGLPGPKPPAGTPAQVVNGVTVYNQEAANLLDNGGDEDNHWVLKAKSNPLAWLGINMQADYSTMESYSYNRYKSGAALVGNKSWTTNDILGLEGNVELKPFNGGTLLAGVQHKAYDWENKGLDLNPDGSDNIASLAVATADYHTTGLFGEAQYRPSKYVKATIGVRHEDHSEFGTEVLPRYGLIINPFDTTALKLNTGKHFKAPDANDLFYPYEEYDYIVVKYIFQSNPDLKPETGWHTDVTLEQHLLNKKLFFSLSYFNWDIDDKIRWGEDIVGIVHTWEPKNLDHYEAYGWEVGTKIGPFFNTSLSLNYTYTDAEEQLDQGVLRQAQYTTKNFFKGSLTHWLNFGMDVNLVARFTDERPARYANDTDDLPSEKLDAYWLFDLKINQRLFENWVVSGQANNLMDEEYNAYIKNFLLTPAGYPGAGRSIFVSVAYEY